MTLVIITITGVIIATPTEAQEPPEREGAPKGPSIQLATGDVLDLTDGLTPTDVAETLVGAGITISNETHTGQATQLGTFEDDDAAVGLESGIILSAGQVKDVVGPNTQANTTTSFGTAGDADLDALSGFTTFDASVLEFDFTVPPLAERITMRYVFGSEEYNEYVGTVFNDVFGFFVNGVNCATVDGSPVDVNQINNGADPNIGGAVIQPTNPESYVNNDPFHPDISGSPLPAALYDTEMDGFTVVLTCDAEVSDSGTNTMKIAIADASDRLLDPWVLLEAASLTIVPISVDIDIKPGSDPNSINSTSRGVIPVAILVSADFDVADIDQTSLTFGSTGDEESLRLRGNGMPQCGFEDVNGDDITDLVCHFDTQTAGFEEGDTEGILKGMTTDGLPFEGSDAVNIVK